MNIDFPKFESNSKQRAKRGYSTLDEVDVQDTDARMLQASLWHGIIKVFAPAPTNVFNKVSPSGLQQWIQRMKRRNDITGSMGSIINDHRKMAAILKNFIFQSLQITNFSLVSYMHCIILPRQKLLAHFLHTMLIDVDHMYFCFRIKFGPKLGRCSRTIGHVATKSNFQQTVAGI